jgi:hypothetical protein
VQDGKVFSDDSVQPCLIRNLDYHVNLLHQGRPLHGSGNHLVSPRTSLWPTEEIEIAGHDYPSNDADDAFAAFVHPGIIHLSLFRRCGFVLLFYAQSQGQEPVFDS